MNPAKPRFRADRPDIRIAAGGRPGDSVPARDRDVDTAERLDVVGADVDEIAGRAVAVDLGVAVLIAVAGIGQAKLEPDEARGEVGEALGVVVREVLDIGAAESRQEHVGADARAGPRDEGGGRPGVDVQERHVGRRIAHQGAGRSLGSQNDAAERAIDEQRCLVDLVAGACRLELDVGADRDAVVERDRGQEVDLGVLLRIDAVVIAIETDRAVARGGAGEHPGIDVRTRKGDELLHVAAEPHLPLRRPGGRREAGDECDGAGAQQSLIHDVPCEAQAALPWQDRATPTAPPPTPCRHRPRPGRDTCTTRSGSQNGEIVNGWRAGITKDRATDKGLMHR